MSVVNASPQAKTVGDPCAEYESLLSAWRRSRALCSGEKFVKDYDGHLDVNNFTNLLLPFSPSMTPQQYKFYKAEAELPGITAEFSKMLVSGLLRKQPLVTLPSSLPEEALDWIKNEFNQDSTSLLSFLDSIIWEEIQTSRAWVYVDYPAVSNAEDTTPAERKNLKPYPIIWSTETVINWGIARDAEGKTILKRIVVRGMEESFAKNEFHPELVEVVKVHEIDPEGYYQIRTFKPQGPDNNVQVINGQRQQPQDRIRFDEVLPPITNILLAGERLKYIPAWPLNGQVKPVEPMLNAIIDKEIALYNKMSRRNHLLYGAATYTPIIAADMRDEDFEEIVAQGLGSWIKLPAGATADVLKTPTEALADMEKAIAANIEEMAKLGIRMLTPESAQSGVALDIRNAAQTARLGSLSNKVSATMQAVIAFMLSWRYGKVIKASEVQFKLSEDFDATPVGADWLRLATEWYEAGHIPRAVWLQILKQNDMVQPDYDDVKGQEDIAKEKETAFNNAGNDRFAANLMEQNDKVVPIIQKTK